MIVLILFSLISTALWYLGSRALVTRWLWSKYPKPLSEFMDCPACVGFWWGLLLDWQVSPHVGGHALGLPSWPIWTLILTGLCLLVTTPIVAGLMQRGFDSAGTVSHGQ